MKQNISDLERLASIAIGAGVIALLAARREGRATATILGGGLIARGVSGYCPISAAIGRDTNTSDTRQALGGARGVHVREAITIAKPLQEVYAFWRDFTNLPRFMSHLERVEVIDTSHSRWTARGPAGMTVSWDAKIINEIPFDTIGWRSVEDADVVSAGSVRFTAQPGGATEIAVHLQYEPPAGKLGAWIATLFGEEPSQQIRSDLQRLKAFLETAKVVTTP
jgi:uncharacterized membrane protein